jgi:hypothetical protein
MVSRSQFIHLLCVSPTRVDFTRIVPIAVIASLVVHQRDRHFVVAPPDISFSARYDPCATRTSLHTTLL